MDDAWREAEKTGVEVYYEWSDVLEGNNRSKWDSPFAPTAAIGTTEAALGADLLIRGVPSGSFYDLSLQLQQKFKDAGLGRDLGARTSAEAQSLFQDSIPYPVRNLGEDAIRHFTDGKDASHIQSVQNAPELARDSNNLIWERSGINRARGSEDMMGMEQFRA